MAFTAAEKQARYRIRHPERSVESVRRYQESEKGKKTIADYTASGRRSAVLKKYNQSEKAAAVDAKYRKTEKNRACQQRYDAKPESLLRRRLRDRVRKIIKRGKGTRAGSAIRDLGCSIAQLKEYISGKFQPGMSWDNYGSWHLDHIKPISLFDLSVREQFIEACHYTNLQPLWAKENLRKHNRWAG